MKKVLLTIAALIIMTNAALAAPVTDLQKGQSIIGYNYWSPDLKNGSYSQSNIYTFNEEGVGAGINFKF
ncbi:MAG: hypothetical protein H6Q74_3132 [Firmicutes bacterium]|nr:hypothetical protein [Bacillota bacterium]